MKRALIVICLGLCLTAVCSLAFAQQAADLGAAAAFMAYANGRAIPAVPVEPEDEFLTAINASPDGSYNDFPTNKMALGAINAATSWSDVPAEIAETSARQDIFNGITFGFARGLAQGFTRGMAGLVDIATFPLPPYDKALMEPEYQSEDTNKEFKVAIFKW